MSGGMGLRKRCCVRCRTMQPIKGGKLIGVTTRGTGRFVGACCRTDLVPVNPLHERAIREALMQAGVR